MIISHKHKFIFIKTEKTAGTSFEIALSKFCGRDDIITPISVEDELVRKRLGYRKPQNYYLPIGRYLKSDYLRLIKSRKPVAFFNHCSAHFIKNHISAEVWEGYYKFCFERNPLSKIISWYKWLNRSGKWESFSDFLKSPQAFRVKGIQLYTIDSHIVVDEIFKFEELDYACEKISQRCGLPEKLSLVSTKSSGTSVKTLVPDNEEKKLLTQVYARELTMFDYSIDSELVS